MYKGNEYRRLENSKFAPDQGKSGFKSRSSPSDADAAYKIQLKAALPETKLTNQYYPPSP